MNTEELQKQTNTNIQEKANLIWEIATHLYGEYKPHEYGRVILPMTVIKRFDDALKDTKSEVVAAAKQLDDRGVEGIARDAILKEVAKHDFYNTSKFDFASLMADSDNITANFTAYLQGFSDNVKDIISRFEFDKEIQKMSENDLLFTIITEFNSKKADMSPDHVTSQDMGYIFEELIRKFSESYDEQAGAHFTARDIIYLMTDLLIAPEREQIKANGCAKTAYDMAMGTSQMLACLDERLKAVNPNSSLKCFGQEFNPETFAIAKADMLIKGGDADNMKFGDTLSNDQFTDYKFDYIISNPPFGIDWKKEETAVETEAKLGFDGRFGPGLPSISDGQMLFLLNGVKKLKENGRMAIIQNGSSLFTGDAGSGSSEIRRYLLENDMLEAVIQLPNGLFYNTGISTYIWLVTSKNGKPTERMGKVQLIDASDCYSKRKKNIGNKRVDLSEACIDFIIKAYSDFSTKIYDGFEDDAKQNPIHIESKVFDNSFFGFYKCSVETALKNEEGKYVLRKGQKQPVKGMGDTEIIPLGVDEDLYMRENVLPYNPDAYIDESKRQIGYEIPFIRLFYKFVPPEKSEVVFRQIQDLEKEEETLMEELFDHE
jgi:type I restriction enzyme M protein